jgi:hypothetical protein
MSILLLFSDALPYDVLKIISNYCGKTELNISIEKFDKSDLKNIKNIKKNRFFEELMAYIFHPRNMDKWINWGFTEHQEMLEFIGE